MGFYQYVMRDRILGDNSPEDDLLDMDVDEMDESPQFLLLQMLANEHGDTGIDAAGFSSEPDARSA